ncbi:MAG: glycerol-3-phosphate dehydrogenase/oxidase [Caldilineae bacterium]|nr:MAG: glycerol-3-phosphate dehydrogenase/oxidase [Caldilineae bacterium]
MTSTVASTPTPEHAPWPPGWRQRAWSRLAHGWDLIVIGGGITGAGILNLAARSGMRVLLLEQGDFASGTSGRSSKLVHGGLRYLKQMRLRLTRESVQERQRLLAAAPELIRPLNFIYPLYQGDRPGAWLMELGLEMYTHLAQGAGGYQTLDAVELLMLAPGLKQQGFEVGYLYGDACTDDARLVLRVLGEGLLAGQGRACALNYARVTGLLRRNGRVVGVAVRDASSGEEAEATAKVVINATGAWADRLRAELAAPARLRPLRGSHLFFRLDRFPVYQAVAMLHPDDGRPVFVYPWEGIVLLGTTDVDHAADLDEEPVISSAEAEYLLRVVQTYFPDLGLTMADVISTQAGVRPVVDTGKANPSAETREHVTWPEEGLLTVTGGKLTTFRLIALDGLRAARELAPDLPAVSPQALPFSPRPADVRLPAVDTETARRLWGRYGAQAPAVVLYSPDWLEPVPETPYLWAEMFWSAAHEAVVHLDDLLLRRFRCGLLLADGGMGLLSRLRADLQSIMGWDDERWHLEVARYREIWQRAHAVPR